MLGTIRDIWVDLLGVADIGDDDDFFDVGGHSLIAIRLMSRIHKELGVRFQLATIFDAPTIAGARRQGARGPARPRRRARRRGGGDDAPRGRRRPSDRQRRRRDRRRRAQPAHQSLVTISPSGDKAPLFIVHGAGGNVLFLWSLARAMAGSRPIYGFQAHGVDGSDMPDPTIEAMAARYVAELRAAPPAGRTSSAATPAAASSRSRWSASSQALGEEVRYVVLFDSVPPGRADRARACAAAQPARQHPPPRAHGPLKPYITEHARRAVRQALHPASGSGASSRSRHEQRELGIRDVEALGFVNLFYYFSAAADRYEMQQRSTSTPRCSRPSGCGRCQPHDYYWGRHINGHLDIAEVPGDHNAMFYPGERSAPRRGARPAARSSRTMSRCEAARRSPVGTAHNTTVDVWWFRGDRGSCFPSSTGLSWTKCVGSAPKEIGDASVPAGRCSVRSSPSTPPNIPLR